MFAPVEWRLGWQPLPVLLQAWDTRFRTHLSRYHPAGARRIVPVPGPYFALVEDTLSPEYALPITATFQ